MAASGLAQSNRHEAALREIVRRLKDEEIPYANDEDLSFLHPTDKAGVLGLLGHYEVQEQIGRGGMGVVLKATDPALNRVVAIKVLTPKLAASSTARRRFIREGRAAAAVVHDFIVTVYSVEEDAGIPYLIMQHIEGESLQDRLDRAGPLELLSIVEIARQAATGLAAAHAHGLIHRDIKPANLLLEKPQSLGDRVANAGSCRVKITDFGLARMADDVQVTHDGTVLGTPEYMAPEQARGERMDQRADLFSLGSVLYAMCTGTPPFQALSALAMLRQVSEETPTPVRQVNPGIPTGLEAIISKLMQKDPDRRFQEAGEVAGVLEGFLAHLRQPDKVAAPTLESPLAESAISARAPKRRRRAPLFLTALAVCVSAVALLVFALFFQDTPQTADPPSAPQFATEVYQDFRGKPPMLPQFRLLGPDLKTVTKSEEAGFRVTLPKTRKVHQPVEIAATFVIKRDFEITGSYELLAADMPVSGYGVGVCLNISTTNDLKKYLKISRVLRADFRSVFMAEYWTKGADDWAGPQVDTEVKGGQLRLVRAGSRALCEVSEGPGKEFRTIFDKEDFGTEDMAYLRFQVTDGLKPGGALDARLLDLRIRHDYVGPARVARPVAPASDGPENRGSGTLALVLAVSLMITLIAIALVSYLHISRRHDARNAQRPDVMSTAPAAAHAAIFACTACGKKLRIKDTSAGKKVKCPKCGQAILAPNKDNLKA